MKRQSDRPLEDRLRDVYTMALETSRRGVATHIAVGFGVMNDLEDWVRARCDWPTLPASPTVWGHPLILDGALPLRMKAWRGLWDRA